MFHNRDRAHHNARVTCDWIPSECHAGAYKRTCEAVKYSADGESGRMRNAFHHRRLFQCKSAAITLLAGISLLQDGLRSSWAAKTTIGAATAQSLQEQTLTPADACADFVADGQGSHEHSEEGGRGRGSLDSARSSLAPWTEGDCVDVWGKWTTTLPSSLYRRGSDPHMLRDSAAIMRARGELGGWVGG